MLPVRNRRKFASFMGATKATRLFMLVRLPFPLTGCRPQMFFQFWDSLEAHAHSWLAAHAIHEQQEMPLPWAGSQEYFPRVAKP
jgi:hypothetical protein